MSTDSQIEAAARAIREVFAKRIGANATPWEKLKPYQQEAYRDEARAALAAAELP